MEVMCAPQTVRVLICDENPLQRSLLQDWLSCHPGLAVVGVASDGVEALQKMQDTHPDVVVVDMATPQMGGFELLEQVRGMKAPPHIIALTAVRDEQFIEQALRLGVSYYMLKPVDGERLRRRVLSVAGQPDMRPARPVLQSLRALEAKIGAILLQLRMPAHLSGYRFLRTAVLSVMENPALMRHVTKELYPVVAEKYGTTAGCVERSIRHAIATAWNRGRPEAFSWLMCCRMQSCDRPTTCEVLSRLVELMQYQHGDLLDGRGELW